MKTNRANSIRLEKYLFNMLLKEKPIKYNINESITLKYEKIIKKHFEYNKTSIIKETNNLNCSNYTDFTCDLRLSNLKITPEKIILDNMDINNKYEIIINIQNISNFPIELSFKVPNNLFDIYINDEKKANAKISPGLHISLVLIYNCFEVKIITTKLSIKDNYSKIYNIPIILNNSYNNILYETSINYGVIQNKQIKSEYVHFINTTNEIMEVSLRKSSNSKINIEFDKDIIKVLPFKRLLNFLNKKNLFKKSKCSSKNNNFNNNNKDLENEVLKKELTLPEKNNNNFKILSKPDESNAIDINYLDPKIQVIINADNISLSQIQEQVEVINNISNEVIGYIDIIGIIIPQQVSLVFANGGGLSSVIDFGSIFYGVSSKIEGYIINNSPYDIQYNVQYFPNKSPDNLVSDISEFNCTPYQAGLELSERVFYANKDEDTITSYSKKKISLYCTTKIAKIKKGFKNNQKFLNSEEEICNNIKASLNNNYTENNSNNNDILDYSLNNCKCTMVFKFNYKNNQTLLYSNNDNNNILYGTSDNNNNILNNFKNYATLNNSKDVLTLDRNISNVYSFKLEDKSNQDSNDEKENNLSNITIFNKCEAIYPILNLDKIKINFCNCSIGQTKYVKLQLTNNSSKLDIDFNFDKIHSFKFNPSTGVLSPSESIDIIVCFFPYNLGNYNSSVKLKYAKNIYNQEINLIGECTQTKFDINVDSLNNINYKKIPLIKKSRYLCGDIPEDKTFATDNLKHCKKNNMIKSFVKDELCKNYTLIRSKIITKASKLDKLIESSRQSILDNYAINNNTTIINNFENKIKLLKMNQKNKELYNSYISYKSKSTTKNNRNKIYPQINNSHLIREDNNLFINDEEKLRLLNRSRLSYRLDVNNLISIPEQKLYLEHKQESLYVTKPIGKWKPKDVLSNTECNTKNNIINKNIPVNTDYKNSIISNFDAQFIYNDLNANELQHIITSSNEIDFDDIFKCSSMTKKFSIANYLQNPILVEFEFNILELNNSFPDIKIINPDTKQEFNIEFNPKEEKKSIYYIKYVINKKYNFKLKISANVISPYAIFTPNIIKFDFRKDKFDINWNLKNKNSLNINSNEMIEFKTNNINKYNFLTINNNDNQYTFESRQTLKIYNPGNSLLKCFTKYSSSYFSIIPNAFDIKPNENLLASLVFNPIDIPNATEIEENIEFIIENGNTLNIKVIAFIPKCSVKSSINSLDFGNIHLGNKKTLSFCLVNELKNITVYSVLESKKIIASAYTVDDCISFNDPVGIIKDKKVIIDVTICSLIMRRFNEDFTIVIRGGPLINIKIKANVIIPKIEIVQKVFDFGKASFGEKIELPITIKNLSNISAYLIFDFRGPKFKHFYFSNRRNNMSDNYFIKNLEKLEYKLPNTTCSKIDNQIKYNNNWNDNNNIDSQDKLIEDISNKEYETIDSNKSSEDSSDIDIELKYFELIVHPESSYELIFVFNPSADLQPEKISCFTDITIKYLDSLIENYNLNNIKKISTQIPTRHSVANTNINNIQDNCFTIMSYYKNTNVLDILNEDTEEYKDNTTNIHSNKSIKVDKNLYLNKNKTIAKSIDKQQAIENELHNKLDKEFNNDNLFNINNISNIEDNNLDTKDTNNFNNLKKNLNNNINKSPNKIKQKKFNKKKDNVFMNNDDNKADILNLEKEENKDIKKNYIIHKESSIKIIKSFLNKKIIAEKVQSKINISPELLDFKKVFITSNISIKNNNCLSLRIYNLESKDLEFKLIFEDSLNSSFFSSNELKGIIPSEKGTYKEIKLTFLPKESKIYNTTFDILVRPLIIDKNKRQTLNEKMILNSIINKEFNISKSNEFIKAKTVRIIGEGVYPRIYFNKRELILPVVPLNIPSRGIIKIKNDGFDNLKLNHQILCDLGSLPLDIKYLNGNLIDFYVNELIVEVSLLAKAPISFTTKVLFYDESFITESSIFISGTSVNSYLSNYLFVEKILFKTDNLYFQKNNLVVDLVNKEIENTSSSVNENTKQKSIKNTVKDNNGKNNYSSINNEELKLILLKHSKHIEYILNYILKNSLSYNITLTFPDSLKDFNTFELLVKLISILSNTSVNTLNKSFNIKKYSNQIINTVCNNKKHSLNNLSNSNLKDNISSNNSELKNISNSNNKKLLENQEVSKKFNSMLLIIKHLQNNGGYLNSISPEYLFDYETFKKIINIESLTDKPVKNVAYNSNKTISKIYNLLNLESWITLIYQILRIYLVNKLNIKTYIKVLKALPESMLNNHLHNLGLFNMSNQNTIASIVNTLSCSNIYSLEEMLILNIYNMYLKNNNTFSKHLQVSNNADKTSQFSNIIDFKTIVDNKEFIYFVLKAYFPNHEMHLNNMEKNKKNSKSLTHISQYVNNSNQMYVCKIFSFLAEYGINSYLDLDSFNDINSCGIIIFSCFLFEYIQYFNDCEVVNFNCVLNDNITKVLTVDNTQHIKNNNANNNLKIEFSIKKEGSDDFIINNNNNNPILEDSINNKPQINNNKINSSYNNTTSAFGDVITLYNNENYQIFVTFRSRVFFQVQSKLYIVNKSNCYTNLLIPKIYLLKSNITERKSIGQRSVLKLPLYSIKDYYLDIKSPFNDRGNYSINVEIYSISYSKAFKAYNISLNNNYNTLSINNYLTNNNLNKSLAIDIDNNLKQTELNKKLVFLKYEDEKNFKIEHNTVKSLSMIINPIEFCIYEINFIFIDNKVGEFQYTLECQVLLPEPLKYIEYECTTNEIKEFSLDINYENSMYEKAIIFQNKNSKIVKNNISKSKSIENNKINTNNNDNKTTNKLIFNVENNISNMLVEKRIVLNTPNKNSINLSLNKNNKDNSYDNLIANNKTALKDSFEINLKYITKFSTKIYGLIILRNTENNNDIRVYKISIKSKPPKIINNISFECPLYEEISQEIPFVNKSDKDIVLVTEFANNLNNGRSPFSIEKELKISKKSTIYFKIKFNPIEFSKNFTTTLYIKNLIFEEVFEYNLKGHILPPLAQKSFEFNVSTSVSKKEYIYVDNMSSKDANFLIHTDMDNIISFPNLGFNSKESVINKLESVVKNKPTTNSKVTIFLKAYSSTKIEILIKTIISKKHFGQIKLVDELDNNNIIWFTITVNSVSNDNNNNTTLKSFVREYTIKEIKIVNNRNDSIKYNANINGKYLYGEKEFVVLPMQTYMYKLKFFPLLVGNYDYNVHIYNENEGELLYNFLCHAVSSPIEEFDVIKAKLGKTIERIITLENPLDYEVDVQYFNNNPNSFFINDCSLNLKNIDSNIIVKKQKNNIVILPPKNKKILKVHYSPSMYNVYEECLIEFSSNILDKWLFKFKGIGEEPDYIQNLTISTYVGNTISSFIEFNNCFNESININISIAENNNNTNNPIFKLTGKSDNVLVPAKETTQINFNFKPLILTKYYCTFIVTDIKTKLNWKYDITGITEVKSKIIDYYLKTKSKVLLEKNLNFYINNVYKKNCNNDNEKLIRHDYNKNETKKSIMSDKSCIQSIDKWSFKLKVLDKMLEEVVKKCLYLELINEEDIINNKDSYIDDISDLNNKASKLFIYLIY